MIQYQTALYMVQKEQREVSYSDIPPAFIIGKIKEKERSRYQPVPLQIPVPSRDSYDRRDRADRPKEGGPSRGVAIIDYSCTPLEQRL